MSDSLGSWTGAILHIAEAEGSFETMVISGYGLVAENACTPVEPPAVLAIQPGQVIRVFYSFRYRVPEQSAMPLWASLYSRVLGIMDRRSDEQTKTEVILPATDDWQTCEGYIDIAIGSDVPGGTYGLIVEVPSVSEVNDAIDACIEVAGEEYGSSDWLGAVVMIAMMGLMTQMGQGMQGTGGGKARYG